MRDFTTSPPAPAVQPLPAVRHVAWLHQEASQPGRAAQFTCRRVLTAAATPEQAAAEALLAYYGPLRPALAPDRVMVDGTTFLVDEWQDAAVWLAPEADPRAVDRARLERGLRHLRAAKSALAQLGGDAPEFSEGLVALPILDAEDYLVTLLAELDASAEVAP